MEEPKIAINITLPPLPKAEDYKVGNAEMNMTILRDALLSWENGAEAIGKALANIKIRKE